jgi:excisionase family DNA binding protein
MLTDTLPPLRANLGQAAALLGMSRSKLYLRIEAGEIQAQKDGRKTYIATTELLRYVAALQAQSHPLPASAPPSIAVPLPPRRPGRPRPPAKTQARPRKVQQASA